MSEIIILTLTLLILATIGGLVNRHSKTAHKLYCMFESFITWATESIAWALMGGK